MTAWLAEHWLQLVTATLGALAVAGVLANNRKARWCFWLWIVTNSGYVLIDVLHTQLWGRAAQHAIFLYLAFEGLVLWRRAAAAERAELERVTEERDLAELKLRLLMDAARPIVEGSQ